jgi:exodeoxyribonuclease VII small subunit
MAKAPSSSPTDADAVTESVPTPDPSTGSTSQAAPEFPDVAGLSYEAARDELGAIVAQLEGGQVPLEEGMRLWRRGEALAAHCTSWLDGAQRQISEAGPASAP